MSLRMEITKEDIEDLEDHFIDIKDEWLMAPSKWLYDQTTAPKNFKIGDYKFYYNFYIPFGNRLNLMHKCKNVVVFSILESIRVSNYQADRDKVKLFRDIEKFLIEIEHLGWKVLDWSKSRMNFINNI